MLKLIVPKSQVKEIIRTYSTQLVIIYVKPMSVEENSIYQISSVTQMYSSSHKAPYFNMCETNADCSATDFISCHVLDRKNVFLKAYAKIYLFPIVTNRLVAISGLEKSCYIYYNPLLTRPVQEWGKTWETRRKFSIVHLLCKLN